MHTPLKKTQRLGRNYHMLKIHRTNKILKNQNIGSPQQNTTITQELSHVVNSPTQQNFDKSKYWYLPQKNATIMQELLHVVISPTQQNGLQNIVGSVNLQQVIISA